MNEHAAAAVAGALLFYLLVGAAFYVYFSYCLMVIGRKTGQRELWMAWVPIVQILLMCNVAGKPWWWLLLCLIPCVNVVIGILLWMGIAQARGKPSWWGILTLVPCVNLIVPAYLAFSD